MGNIDGLDFDFNESAQKRTQTTDSRKSRRNRIADAEKDITEFVVFLKSLKVLLRTNRTMIDIVGTLEENSAGKLKKTLKAVKEDVISGKSLSSAFRNSGFFSENFCNIFEVGENSGAMEKSLDSYVLYMTKTMGMRRLLKSAMTYPTVMISAIIVAMIAIVVYVIPSFKEIVGNIVGGRTDIELNLATRIFFGASDLAEPLGEIVPVILIIGVICFMFTVGKSWMAKMFERRVPKLRQVKSEMDWGQWLLLGSVCIEAGMLVPKTLKVLGDGETENLPSEFRAPGENGSIVYDDILYRINGGEKLSTTFREYGAPSLISNSIGIAEESGNLWETMKDLADIYLDGVDFKIKNIAEIINPIITVIIAAFVGMLVGGLLSVMMSLNELASQV
jgi:type II secretory pathway component PulF